MFYKDGDGFRGGGTLPFPLSVLTISSQGNLPALAGTFK
jgi:hypothetical protein